MGKYNPEKNYSWTPEDKFELTGEQFGIMLNSFRAILATPEAQRILMINRANNEIEKIIEKAVENGDIKEAAPPPPPNGPTAEKTPPMEVVKS